MRTNTTNNNGEVKLFAGEDKFLFRNWDGSLALPEKPEKLTICIHDGEFHADELVCVNIIKLWYAGDGTQIEVVRSRKEEDWNRADLVIDVGEGLLDHHGKRAEQGVAACTRVYALLLNSGLCELAGSHVAQKLKAMVDSVAAIDTGVEGAVNLFPEVHDFSMWGVARNMEDKAFETADQAVFTRLLCLNDTWMRESAAIQQALAAVAAPREDERVCVFEFDTRLADVKKLLWDRKDPAVFFVSPAKGNDWRVLCAAPTDTGYSYFASKQLIPEKYRGLRAEELNKSTGLEGCIFSHAAGFIAGFKTKEDAVAFAKICLEMR